MSHTFIDKRGANHNPKRDEPKAAKKCHIPKADKAAKTQPDVVLAPFPDGTCMKHYPRPWPGKPEDKPATYDDAPQHILVNTEGKQLAITAGESLAELFCDAVNSLFAAQQMLAKQRSDAAQAVELTDKIVSAKFRE